MDSSPRVRRLLPLLLPHLAPMTRQGCQGCPEHLKQLEAALGNVSDEDLDTLAEHVTFPFEVYLESPWLPENHTVNSLDFLARYFHRAPLRRYYPLKELLNLSWNV